MKDFHTHTIFSDGKNSPEEMAEAAFALGLTDFGFSDHSYTAFDESYCIKKEKIGEYKERVISLKNKYYGKMNIWLGIEQDYYAEVPAEGYDYIIGSVHYVKTKNGYFPIDESPDDFINLINNEFGGEPYALIQSYFDNVADVVNKTGCDIIGHFDLISKFNEKLGIFDEKSEKYRKIWMESLDFLLNSGKIFEINTGAMARGYKSNPYPNPEMIDYIKERGGKFVLSSDTHQMENICFAFKNYSELIK